ncbi:MAG: hypothetical protein ACKOJF_00700, partial [Planctomycetaceae bacterium]
MDSGFRWAPPTQAPLDLGFGSRGIGRGLRAARWGIALRDAGAPDTLREEPVFAAPWWFPLVPR